MIKKIAWETFKNTGDINTFMELKHFESIERQIKNQNQEDSKINNKFDIKKEL